MYICKFIITIMNHYYCRLENSHELNYYISSIKEHLIQITNSESINGKKLLFRDWGDLLESGIDVYLVNIGVCLIEKGITDLEDWKNEMIEITFPFLSTLGVHPAEMENILAHVWYSRFAKTQKEINKANERASHWAENPYKILPTIEDLSFKNSHIFVRLLCNNTAFWGGILLLTIINLNIFRTHSGIVCFYHPIALLMVANLYKWKYSILGPIVLGLVFSAYYIIFEKNGVYLAFESAKESILSGLTYIILLPIILINERRYNNAFLKHKPTKQNLH